MSGACLLPCRRTALALVQKLRAHIGWEVSPPPFSSLSWAGSGNERLMPLLPDLLPRT